ncbi:hypothetical protein ABZV58_17815 [Nocardia sp. NPDC004654]|uniref:hypothetical protein n=1 Tax=Nocardia sp. NPDC004654 TaxID=3154776 RepID=UPI0033B0842D
MTTRTALLLVGLAVFGVALLTTNWHPIRAVAYLAGWALVAILLIWNDRRNRARQRENTHA